MKKTKIVYLTSVKRSLKGIMVVILTFIICQTHAQSMYWAKQYYDQGKYLEAAKQLRPLADGGNAEAQIMAAKMFFEGKGVAKNDAQGVKYAMLAADQCNEKAILLLATHYYEANNLSKMFSTLKTYIDKHPYLLKQEVGASLAKCYLYGVGTTADKEKAWSIILNGNTHADEFKKECAEEWNAYQNNHPEEYKIWDVVEQMPQFPGGNSALFQWLNENAPSRYIGDSPGRVVYNFVIKRDGSIDDIKVISNPANLSKTTTNMTIDVLKKMPKWIPGRQNGKAVNVKYTIPITYRD